MICLATVQWLLHMSICLCVSHFCWHPSPPPPPTQLVWPPLATSYTVHLPFSPLTHQLDAHSSGYQQGVYMLEESLGVLYCETCAEACERLDIT